MSRAGPAATLAGQESAIHGDYVVDKHGSADRILFKERRHVRSIGPVLPPRIRRGAFTSVADLKAAIHDDLEHIMPAQSRSPGLSSPYSGPS